MQHNPEVAVAQLTEAENLISVLRDRSVVLRYQLNAAQQENQMLQAEVETLRARVSELEPELPDVEHNSEEVE